MNHLLRVFKALSDETRLRVMILLKQKKLCVYEICEILDLPQSKVSKHLSKLKDLDFVSSERKEQYMYYSLKLIDPILCDLIDDIILNITKYPQIKKDKDNLLNRVNNSDIVNLDTK
ncbi:ArsR/SmtB family transcription factor [Helicovermis profundi]|uniref:Metalloregulator ArsR/SmtB family transcription factor n=1 Tax=Helicovermis profundi TaxID=3065157 RepID=A0AAU9E682_9FIRM|nr:metalloregulator ArsR/SmtB family transcription factor [Clostridia bacterium S502]